MLIHVEVAMKECLAGSVPASEISLASCVVSLQSSFAERIRTAICFLPVLRPCIIIEQTYESNRRRNTELSL